MLSVIMFFPFSSLIIIIIIIIIIFQFLLCILPKKLDVADPINVALTVSEWLSVEDPESIIPTSARSRIGIVPLLDKICRMVPPPSRLPDDNYIEDNDNNQHLRAQVVDSWYDERGVNCLVQIASGTIAEGDRIAIVTGTKSSTTSSSVQSFSVQEVGIVLPHSVRTGKLRRGQMGYVRFGLKDPSQVDTGTILIFHKDVGKDIYIPSINQSIINDNSADSTKSVLFASVHPLAEDGFEDLCDAVDRLGLNDKGLEISRTSDGGANNSESGGPFLGPGLRIGFQGLLHVEVFRQRLTDEFGIDAVVTPPKVPYHVTFLPSKANNLTDPIKRVVEDLEDWPVFGEKFRVEEPMVEVRLMSPVQYAGAVMELITNKRGIDLTTKPIDENIWMFQAQMPWAEVVLNFHDMLKTITGGYGSLGTFEADPPLREARLSKVEILLNGDEVGPLSFVCHTPNAQSDARIVCKKLKDVLPRQQFVIVIQAKADGKVIASERIQAYRKDVLNKSGKMVGGGDISRKKKLLEKQKKGKKRSQSSGKVTLSQAAFNSVISR
ncbi:MAG: GTP-binding protein LepA [Bacillariaceae sp.]|jgi:GTP-binding protein LepA